MLVIIPVYNVYVSIYKDVKESFILQIKANKHQEEYNI